MNYHKNENKNIFSLSNIYEQIEKKIQKDEILKIFGDLENPPTLRGDYLILKSLLIIYDFQTEDEKDAEQTKIYNNVGFSGVDGQLLSSFAKQLENKFYLSPKQMNITRKKMRRYVNQIIRLINSGEISKNMNTSESRFRDMVLKKWKEKARFYYDENGIIKNNG